MKKIIKMKDEHNDDFDGEKLLMLVLFVCVAFGICVNPIYMTGCEEENSLSVFG